MSDVTLTREEYNDLIADRDRARSLAAALEAENVTLLEAIRNVQASANVTALLCAEAIVKVEAAE
jgi:hypothetical protein